MSDRWEARLRELKEFKEEHGHCNVPRNHPGGLGNWVMNQRCGGKEGSQCRNAERTKKLEELGFQWRMAGSDRWELRFRELKEFKEEHGHCDVPQKHPGGLGIWANNQRRGGKEGSQRCNAERSQKLEELGFQWGIAGKNSDQWELKFRELKEFKEAHGHCDAPRNYPGGLGIWVNNQRRRNKDGSQRPNAEQAQKLEELGFRWDTVKRCSWEERFEQLKGFNEEHGHCTVPRKHPGGLGFWVEYQRSTRGSQHCDASQTRKLEELGLEKLGVRWDTATRCSWEARFRELKEFKEEHGHCDVPQKHPGGLGRWVMNQRRGGKEKSQLRNAKQAQRLEALGFQWNAVKRLDRWKARIQELKEFKEEQGHCDVPRNYPGGLGIWVNNQRSRKSSRRRDSSQTQKLEQLGLKLLPPLMTHRGNEQEPSICDLPARSACEAVAVEQAWRQMQAAAARGDYVLAGKLQATLARLITLWQGMQQAAHQGNFILAGHLQIQMNAFMESVAKEMAT